MPTDTEIWERACERVGAFDKDNNPSISTHYYPAIGDPTAVVAMLEYARFRLDAEKFVAIFRPTNWKRALANAVLAVPQETQP